MIAPVKSRRVKTESAAGPRVPVVLVTPVGDLGGAEQVLLTVAKGLRPRGYEPVIACMRPGRLLEVARSHGVAARSFAPHRMRDVVRVVRGVRWLGMVCRQHGAELIHASHTSFLYAGPASRMTGVPAIWHLHDYPHRVDAIERLMRTTRPAGAIFTTPTVRSGYGALASGRHALIPPVTFDREAADRLAAEAGELEVDLGTGPVLLTVARLQPHKGLEDLVEAAPRVLAGRPDATFVIVGAAGDEEQRAYAGRLRDRARALGVERAFRWLGFVDDATLHGLYRRATVLVHPARSEGFGLTLIEAMSHGLAVVATAADGPRSIVRDGVDGLLTPVSDPGALAEATERVLGDDGLRQDMAAAGRAAAVHRTAEVMVDQTAAFYDEVLGRGMVRRGGPTATANAGGGG